MTYCLRVPIQFPSYKRIDVGDNGVEGLIDGFPASLTSEGGATTYILSIDGLPNEGAGEKLLRRLKSGLYWTALELKTGIRASFTPQKVTYADNPEKFGERFLTDGPLDFVFDGGQPAVFPVDKPYKILRAGSVFVQMTVRGAKFFESLSVGLQSASPDNLDGDERLAAAFDLYFLSYMETNQTARFILQCAALETLAPETDVASEQVQKLVNKWNEEASEHAQQEGLSDLDKADLVALQRRLEQLRRRSHRGRIRDFVRNCLLRAGHTEEDAQESVSQVVNAYDVRGRLMHAGRVDEIGQAGVVLHDVLPILFKQVLIDPDLRRV